ncbi:hypothetical protein [Streptomyces sp. NPDC058657]|uniref:hypothetical protein n=1 Tax=unclassified Streptomyces TaxID=2593676 RepID=UPI003646D788
MSQEAVPEQATPANPVPTSEPGRQSAPKGLLQQMEELMAALTADLSQLDADLQSTADRPPATAGTSGGTGTGNGQGTGDGTRTTGGTIATGTSGAIGTTRGTGPTGTAGEHREDPRTRDAQGQYDGDRDRSR